MMRTYAGHSTPEASNALYRSNLEKGQTGLSIAFDLPTQTGYDPDDILAAGEVGKVGVPIVHLGHMQTLLDGIPVGQMNTSMTINAPASWLLALHIANAETQGVARAELRGTTQNDIVKEYLSRGTYIFPPEPSLRLIVDMIAFCAAEVPAWNPINICSYHLQEAGAAPVQELSFALANAIAVLDAVRASGQVADDAFGQVVGSVSFFVNAGIRFVEETAKMRAFTQMWEQITRDRYGVTDPKQRRFRYGVQVNSLGLTESQPENNVQRIVLEMLGVTLSKDARARSIQLPAWNEALGLPRPWDQQWALRMQQVLAFETDLLEYDDIFAGSHVIEALTSDLMADAWSELNGIIERGGAFAAIEDMKRSLVESNARRVRSIETGDTTVVGRNHFTESEPSALGGSEAILRVDPHVGQQMVADVEQWRTSRDRAAAEAAIDELRRVASSTENIMAATIECARAGVTTGEWAHALRGVFGEYQGPTGVAQAAAVGTAALGVLANFHQGLADGPPKVLIAKPGLDGHSNGAEQIALAARDSGMEVVYQGIRRTPDQIAATARDEDVDLIGLSVLSGSHVELVPAVLAALAAVGVHAPVIVGGIIPGEDHEALRSAGVARIYTPSDYEIGAMMSDLSELALAARA
ncbi:MAG: protein meaA [Acidimicrobiaceae bacterium]|nr:protein meaA [Acidimicrobiaceae bacterium]